MLSCACPSYALVDNKGWVRQVLRKLLETMNHACLTVTPTGINWSLYIFILPGPEPEEGLVREEDFGADGVRSSGRRQWRALALRVSLTDDWSSTPSKHPIQQALLPSSLRSLSLSRLQTAVPLHWAPAAMNGIPFQQFSDKATAHLFFSCSPPPVDWKPYIKQPPIDELSQRHTFY
jgi:hypothetical protein